MSIETDRIYGAPKQGWRTQIIDHRGLAGIENDLPQIKYGWVVCGISPDSRRGRLLRHWRFNLGSGHIVARQRAGAIHP